MVCVKIGNHSKGVYMLTFVSFDIYLQEQKLARVEQQFAKAIGVPINEKASEPSSIITTINNRMSKKRPKNILSQKQQTVPIPKDLLMYRLITFIQGN